MCLLHVLEHRKQKMTAVISTDLISEQSIFILFSKAALSPSFSRAARHTSPVVHSNQENNTPATSGNF